MPIIRGGRSFEVALFVVILAIYLYWYWRRSTGQSIPQIRSFPALDAIEEGVGRSIETGNPVHFGLGDASVLGGDRAAGTISALNFLKHTASLCARLGAKFIVRISPNPHLHAQAEALLEDAYLAEGKPEELDKVYSIRYYGDYFGYLTGGMRDMSTLGVAMNVTIGALSVETIWAFAICRRMGGIGIGGGSRWGMVFGLAMLADYALLGDEMYAASAKISGDEVMSMSMIVGDWAKFLLIAMTIVFAGLYLAGASGAITTFLGL